MFKIWRNLGSDNHRPWGEVGRKRKTDTEKGRQRDRGTQTDIHTDRGRGREGVRGMVVDG